MNKINTHSIYSLCVGRLDPVLSGALLTVLGYNDYYKIMNHLHAPKLKLFVFYCLWSIIMY